MRRSAALARVQQARWSSLSQRERAESATDSCRLRPLTRSVSGSLNFEQPGRADPDRTAHDAAGRVYRQARHHHAVEQHLSPARGHHSALQRHQARCRPSTSRPIGGAIHHLPAARARGSAHVAVLQCQDRRDAELHAPGRRARPDAATRHAPARRIARTDQACRAGAAHRGRGGRRHGWHMIVVGHHACTPRRIRLSCTVPIARSLPGITRLENIDRVAFAQLDVADGVSAWRFAPSALRGLALAAGDQDQQIVVRNVGGRVLGGECAACPCSGSRISRAAALQVAQASARPRATVRPASRAAMATTDSTRATLLAKQVTATRPSQRGDQLGQTVSRTHLALRAGVSPSTMCVGAESQTIASTPSIAQRRRMPPHRSAAPPAASDRTSSRRCAATVP